METKTDISYGVIPLIKRGDEWFVLLVHMISLKGDKFWALPKGHGEGEESAVAAALRELKEETGVEQVTLDFKKTFLTAYTFEHEGARVNKAVQYWIGYCENEETVITHPEEITELAWYDFETAFRLLEHPNAKNILIEVEQYLID